MAPRGRAAQPSRDTRKTNYTNAATANKVWGSLKTNLKAYIGDLFATIPKMVSTHHSFYLDKED